MRFIKGTRMLWTVFKHTKIDYRKFQTDLYNPVDVIEILEEANLIRVDFGENGPEYVTALQHIEAEDVDAVLARSGIYEEPENFLIVLRYCLFGSLPSKRRRPKNRL